MKKKYQKPQITNKKVKLSFFLTKISYIDQFNIIGNIYASSGGGSDSGTGTTS